MTKITLIRHGQTAWNAEKRYMGQKNIALDKTGEQQVAALGHRLGNIPFSAYYSSDLQRALQTAQAIAGLSNKNVVAYPELRERNMGIFQGHTKEESAKLFPQQWQAFQDGDYQNHPVPEGESGEQFYTRSVNIFNTLADKHPEESIVVVSHGGLISNVFRYVLNAPSLQSTHFRCHNTSVNIFSRENLMWRLEAWGDISHLGKRIA